LPCNDQYLLNHILMAMGRAARDGGGGAGEVRRLGELDGIGALL
jgi:hypothetical protein